MNDACPTCGRCQACGSKGDTGMTIFSSSVNAAAAAPGPIYNIEIPSNTAAAQPFTTCEHVKVV